MLPMVPLFWDNMAALYDSDVIRAAFLPHYVETSMQLAEIRTSSMQNITVLDIGTGTGPMVEQIINLQNVSQIIATDFAAKMLEQVQAKHFANKKLKTWVLDAQQLTPIIEANSIDIAFCQFVYMFVPDKKKAFHELYQVLKPKGRAVITTVKDNQASKFLGYTLVFQIAPELNAQYAVYDIGMCLANELEVQQMIAEAAPFAGIAYHKAEYAEYIPFEQFVTLNESMLQRVSQTHPHVPEQWHKLAQTYNENGKIRLHLICNVFVVTK